MRLTLPQSLAECKPRPGIPWPQIIGTRNRLKLPDAIIAATALCERASLVTSDQQVQATAVVPVVRF